MTTHTEDTTLSDAAQAIVHFTAKCFGIACHEAGHALFAVLAGQAIRSVTIQPTSEYQGCIWTDWQPSQIASDGGAARIRYLVAGAVSAYVGLDWGCFLYPGWRPSTSGGARSDMDKVKSLFAANAENSAAARHTAEVVARDPTISPATPALDLDLLITETQIALAPAPRRRALLCLAGLLCEHTTLDGDLATAILRDTLCAPSLADGVFIPDVPLCAIPAMLELAGYYDPDQRAWRVPRESRLRAFHLRDAAHAGLLETEPAVDVIDSYLMYWDADEHESPYERTVC